MYIIFFSSLVYFASFLNGNTFIAFVYALSVEVIRLRIMNHEPFTLNRIDSRRRSCWDEELYAYPIAQQRQELVGLGIEQRETIAHGCRSTGVVGSGIAERLVVVVVVEHHAAIFCQVGIALRCRQMPDVETVVERGSPVVWRVEVW